MDRSAFEAALRADGFAEITEASMPPSTTRPVHEHPYEIRGLVLGGVLHLDSDDGAQRFGPGDVFTMAARRRHTEHTGGEGAHFLAGRRVPQTAAQGAR